MQEICEHYGVDAALAPAVKLVECIKVHVHLHPGFAFPSGVDNDHRCGHQALNRCPLSLSLPALCEPGYSLTL